MNPIEFWEITPYEFNLIVKSYIKRQEIKQKSLIYQAYLISRWVWTKKINIEKILKIKNERKVMTDKEMLKQVKILNILLGGEVRNTNDSCNT